MRVLICSDLHGASDSAEFLLSQFQNRKCDLLICLGDVLYHGPRNDLPSGYEPKKVIKILNSIADKILCIRGNCDAEVDQMVLEFPLYPSYDMVINDLHCHLEHGHHLTLENIPTDVIFYGHTHVSCFEKKDHRWLINPGSITMPKEHTQRSYIFWEDHSISLYNFENERIQTLRY